MTLYAVYYCPCVYESAHGLLSIHKTMKGAYKAFKEHRIANYNEWRSRPKRYRRDFLDTALQSWQIDKIKVED